MENSIKALLNERMYLEARVNVDNFRFIIYAHVILLGYNPQKNACCAFNDVTVQIHEVLGKGARTIADEKNGSLVWAKEKDYIKYGEKVSEALFRLTLTEIAVEPDADGESNRGYVTFSNLWGGFSMKAEYAIYDDIIIINSPEKNVTIISDNAYAPNAQWTFERIVCQHLGKERSISRICDSDRVSRKFRAAHWRDVIRSIKDEQPDD